MYWACAKYDKKYKPILYKAVTTSSTAVYPEKQHQARLKRFRDDDDDYSEYNISNSTTSGPSSQLNVIKMLTAGLKKIKKW